MATFRAIERIDGVDICVTRHTGKPLILLLRMASREMGVWDSIWDSLCEHFTVAQFDLTMPHVEMLKQPKTAFGLLSDTCLRVATNLGFERFHLIGWTGGAHIALRCAFDYPQHVESCMLLSPFYALPDMRAVEKGIEFMQAIMERGGRELYSYYWFMSGLSPTFLQTAFESIKKMVDTRLSGDRFIQTDVQRAIRWIRVLRGFWLDDDQLAKIRAPVMIIGPGLDSGFVGPTSQMAKLLQARISGAQLAIAENYGSLFLLEAPEIFPTLTRDFFRQVTRAPR